MAKKVFELTYAWGPTGLTGHVTKLGNDRYLASIIENGRAPRRLLLDRIGFNSFIDGIHELYDQPAHDFNSIFALQRFVKFGHFDATYEDERLFDLMERY